MSTQYATVQNPSLFGNDVLKIVPLRRFYDNMPAWLRIGIEKGKGLTEPIEKSYALKGAKLIQFNAAKLVRYLVFDIDDVHPNDNSEYSNCFYNWHEADMPPPQIIIRNKDNGHCQYFYELKMPVSTSDNSKQNIVFYLHAIRRAMTIQLNADSAYTHYISRNPFNANRQETFYSLVEPYSLDDLSKNLDLTTRFSSHKLEDFLGLGRNNDIFHTVRFDAYSYKRECAKYEQLYSFVLSRCRGVNAEQFADDMLPDNECRYIAKSIARWTWDKYTGKSKHTDKKLSVEKAKIGKKGGNTTGIRKKKNNARKRQKALKLFNEGVSKVQIAKELDVHRNTINEWLKKVKK